MSVLELFKTVIRSDLPFDQLIYEAASRTVKWVHVSHDPNRSRRQIMIAQFGANGRAVAYPTISAEDALALSEPAQRSVMPKVWGYIEMPDAPTEIPEAETSKKPRVRKRRRKTAAKKKRARSAVRKPSPSSKPRKSARGRKRGSGRGIKKQA